MKSNQKFFKKSKFLPVDNFFENILYDNQFGYYATKQPFGRDGDFITSPKVSNLFSEIIAIWLINTWENFGKPKKFNFIELGPGDGLPSVIALKNFIQPSKNPNFTRFNVFLRDKFTCQYCGDKKDLTFDHLLPKSRGGLTDWNNVVTACSSCNVKKGGKLYKDCDLKLANKPYAPTVEDLHRNGRNFPPNFLHESWMDYLYWDIELEP